MKRLNRRDGKPKANLSSVQEARVSVGLFNKLISRSYIGRHFNKYVLYFPGSHIQSSAVWSKSGGAHGDADGTISTAAVAMD